MRTLLALAASAIALALALPLLGALLAAALTASPGPLQLGATVLAAVLLRPVAPVARPVVIDLPDAELLFHLLLNCEVRPRMSSRKILP